MDERGGGGRGGGLVHIADVCHNIVSFPPLTLFCARQPTLQYTVQPRMETWLALRAAIERGGVDVDAVDATNGRPATCAHAAEEGASKRQGRTKCIKHLLNDCNADVDARTREGGNQALLYALVAGEKALPAARLPAADVEKGADPTASLAVAGRVVDNEDVQPDVRNAVLQYWTVGPRRWATRSRLAAGSLSGA